MKIRRLIQKNWTATAFSNPLETLRLNAITHPNVRVRIEWMIKEIRDKEPDALIVIEAALLSEGHLIPLCDDVWYIYTDEQTRIKRIMESRGYSKERCLQTIARQKSDAQFRAECRVVIDNSHSIEETKAQIERQMKKAGKYSILKQIQYPHTSYFIWKVCGFFVQV